MRYWVFCFSCLFSLGLLWSQSTEKLLEQLNRYKFENPDSATLVITKLTARQKSLSSQEKGDFCSNKGIFYAVQGNLKLAIQNLQCAYKYAAPYSIQRLSVLKNLANVYKLNANYLKALAMLGRAQVIAKKLKNKEEELAILGEIAANQYYQFEWSKAIKTNKKVIRELEKIGNDRLLAIQRQRLANIYYSLEQYSAAIKVYQDSKTYYDKYAAEKLNAAYVRINIGDVYFAQNNFRQAIKYYRDAAKRLQGKDVAKYWLANSKLAQSMLELGQITEGFPLLQMSYNEAQNRNLPNLDELLTYLLRYSRNLSQSIKYINIQIDLVRQKKEAGLQFNEITWSGFLTEAVSYYRQTKQFEKATDALLELRKVEKNLNTDFQQEKSRRILDNEANKRTLLKAKNLELDLKYYRSLRWLWTLSIVLLISISGLIYYYSISKTRKQKLQNLKLKLANIDLEERLELEHKNVLLEQELQATKERELAAMSLQLFQLQESIKSDILAMDNKGDNPDVKALQRKFSASLKRKDYWKEFEMKFIQLNPDFHQKLLKDHPSLTKKDLDFCSLVRLNLGNKEIASLTQIAYESVLSKKYKLRKKLGFITENELFIYLQSL